MARADVPYLGGRIVYGAAVLATLATGWRLGFLWFGLAWAVAAWKWPLAPCWHCHGTRVIKASGNRKARVCGRCKNGVRWRVGARSLHRQVRAVRKYRRKQKERQS